MAVLAHSAVKQSVAQTGPVFIKKNVHTHNHIVTVSGEMPTSLTNLWIDVHYLVIRQHSFQWKVKSCRVQLPGVTDGPAVIYHW